MESDAVAAIGPRDVRWIESVLPHRYPMLLVDRVLEIEPRRRIVAIKNVTVNESFFVGHFPGQPVMPGVLVVEGMAQAGGILLLHDIPDRDRKLLYFMSIERARFRRPIVPGDQIRYEVEVLRMRATTCKLAGKAIVDGEVAAEARLPVGDGGSRRRRHRSVGVAGLIHPTAHIDAGARLGSGVRVGAGAVVGPDVEIGDDTEIGAGSPGPRPDAARPREPRLPARLRRLRSAGPQVQGREERADRRRPQHHPRVRHAQPRHRLRAAAPPASATTICSWPTATSATTRRWGAARCSPTAPRWRGTSRWTTTPPSAPLSAVHQFCRVGRHAYIGGFSVITLDALPFARTVGQKPLCYGVNRIGLERKGMTPEAIREIERAFRVLLRSGKNTVAGARGAARTAAAQPRRRLPDRVRRPRASAA